LDTFDYFAASEDRVFAVEAWIGGWIDCTIGAGFF
jgi:hypothetical protein